MVSRRAMRLSRCPDSFPVSEPGKEPTSTNGFEHLLGMRSTKGNNEIFSHVQVSFRYIFGESISLICLNTWWRYPVLKWQPDILFCLLGVNLNCLLKPNNSIWGAIIFQLKNLKDALLASFASQCPHGTLALPVTVTTLLQYLPNAMVLGHFRELLSISTKGQKLCQADVNS